MRLGDTISITREEFIRLAPLGLMLYQPQIRATFCYDPSSVSNSTSSHREIPGYIYAQGSHSSTTLSYSWDHLRGYWDDLIRRSFIVTRLPRTHIYRRTT